ncbi:hypothetical protein DER46DRAFT_687167, partial [Fusarium sp. MPI-SDFR-AT-0072]
ISNNLHQLLYARRSLFHDRVLWVDQICIDQKNGEEIESQIEKMRDSYSLPSAWGCACYDEEG